MKSLSKVIILFKGLWLLCSVCIVMYFKDKSLKSDHFLSYFLIMGSFHAISWLIQIKFCMNHMRPTKETHENQKRPTKATYPSEKETHPSFVGLICFKWVSFGGLFWFIWVSFVGRFRLKRDIPVRGGQHVRISHSREDETRNGHMNGNQKKKLLRLTVERKRSVFFFWISGDGVLSCRECHCIFRKLFVRIWRGSCSYLKGKWH